MKIETIAVHAGHAVDSATGAVAAPIYLSTTFERDIEGTYSRGFMYTRNDNPNRQALERGVSMLEGGEAAAAFASGTGATMSILQALSPGDHVLAHVDAYYGTSRLIHEIFLRWGLEADFVDMSDPDAVRKALRPNTKLAWAETPSNPLLKIVDLAAVAEIVRGPGAIFVCDNTWAPVLQRPFDLGADLVLHSTTQDRAQADVRVRRNAFARSKRRLRCGDAGRGENKDFHSRYQPGRRGKLDRASRLN